MSNNNSDTKGTEKLTKESEGQPCSSKDGAARPVVSWEDIEKSRTKSRVVKKNRHKSYLFCIIEDDYVLEPDALQNRPYPLVGRVTCVEVMSRKLGALAAADFKKKERERRQQQQQQGDGGERSHDGEDEKSSAWHTPAYLDMMRVVRVHGKEYYKAFAELQKTGISTHDIASKINDEVAASGFGTRRTGAIHGSEVMTRGADTKHIQLNVSDKEVQVCEIIPMPAALGMLYQGAVSFAQRSLRPGVEISRRYYESWDNGHQRVFLERFWDAVTRLEGLKLASRLYTNISKNWDSAPPGSGASGEGQGSSSSSDGNRKQ